MVTPLQSVSGTTVTNNTPMTAQYTSNLTSGTKLLAFLHLSDGVQHSQPVLVSIADGNGNNFQLLRDVESTSAGGFFSHYYIYALDTPAADVGTKPTITVTTSGGSVFGYMILQEVPGLLAGNTPLDGNPIIMSGAGGSGLSATVGNFNTGFPVFSDSVSGEYVVSFYGDDGDSSGCTWTAPGSPWTTDPSSVNTQINGNVAVAYKSSIGGTETGGGWAVSVPQFVTNWGLIVAAFKLAATVPVITTVSLLPAPVSAAYSFTLTGSGGSAPYSWSISSGSLPGWATLNAATGVISGTAPGSAGSTTFTVKLTDNASRTATQILTLAVLAVASTNSGTGGVWNSPSQDPQITGNVSGGFGNTPYVGPDAFNVPSGGTQTLTVYTDQLWNTVTDYNNAGGSVGQFVNTGFYYPQNIPIDEYKYIVSGWNDVMDWAPNGGIIASGCYDLWFNASQASEVMIHHYLQNRGGGPYFATGVPFGGYYVQTSAGPIYIPLNYWNLAWATGNTTAFWDIADYTGNLQHPGLPAGAVDVLAMLKWLVTHNIWPARTVTPSGTGFSHGYEVCSTGNVNHSFVSNSFFWYGAKGGSFQRIGDGFSGSGETRIGGDL